ncbi:excinuclease ABC subunit UvrC [Anaplasma phagocytophilum]|uniref:excinuclease ABC subunit UvrC n=1 Tax=Anaplasma phagocytophilum TaxID=948 RepID=UPI0031F9253B
MKNSNERLNDAFYALKKATCSVQKSVPGVYKMFGTEDRLLYVGKAKDLKKRLSSYLSINRMSVNVYTMVKQIIRLEFTVTENETEALLLEAKLIKSLKPKYNIIMRDDKFYPYILFSRHKYPRIVLHREKRAEGRSTGLYGPFLSSVMTKHIIATIKKAFLIRSCPDNFFATRVRPCIEYEMKNCSAPCMQKISEDDYGKAVQMAHKALTGQSKEIQCELFEMMCRFSKNQDYESAIVCRDRLHALKSMKECMGFQTSIHGDVDFIAVYKRQDLYCMQVVFFRDGVNYGSQPYFIESVGNVSDADIVNMFMLQTYNDFPSVVYVDLPSDYDTNIISTAIKKLIKRKVDIRLPATRDELKAMGLARNYAMEALNRRVRNTAQDTDLEEFATFFDLLKAPERIEIYDNSHISGTHPYGVMVVCGKDGLLKKEYRKFKINTVTNGDDCSMMHEVISRRFKEMPDVLPDFILIDGGRGQRSAVYGQLSHLGIPFACIAKGPGRVAGTDVFYLSNGKKLSLDPASKLMHFLCRLRDEAHRFAITSHRKSRDGKLQFSTLLNDIPGIGKTKGKAMLAYFGSIQAMKHARVEEISKVPGISLKLAKRIAEYLKESQTTLRA